MALKENVLEVREKMRKIRESKAEEKFMKIALKQARKAYDIGEVPIGCVIVREGKVIARGYNKRTHDSSVLSHAELIAMKKACKKLGDWRLEDCIMYVTLEPCPMCAGAIIQARIPKVVFGCKNPKAGAAGSIINVLQTKGFNHFSEIESGILEAECSEILSDFFAKMRKRERLEN